MLKEAEVLLAHHNAAVYKTRDPYDFYVTPREAILPLLEKENFGKTIWEPCCGNGAISEVLEAAGYDVYSSDVIDRGYGDVADFLVPATQHIVDSVVTNPPFSRAEEFIRKALECTSFKVAMLLRLKFLESMQRRPLFQETPLKHVYVFSDRVTMYPGDEPNRGNGSGFEAYAWYVWEQGYEGTPQIDWIVTTPSDSSTGAAHVLPNDLLVDDTHDILPGLSSEEYEALKTSIADFGVEVFPMIDQHLNVIDGKARWRASGELGIECPCILRYVESETERLQLRLQLNCNRRHFTRKQKRETIAAYLMTDPQIGNPELGEIMGVSKNTVESVRKTLEGTGQIDHFETLRGKDKKYRKRRRILTNTKKEAGEAADIISQLPETNKVVPFKVAKRKAYRLKRQKEREEAAAKAPPWNDDNIHLYHCRFQDLPKRAEIKPGSVRLYLTDPPYGKDWLDQWDDLGLRAAEDLEDGGLLIPHSGIHFFDQVLAALGKHLEFVWLINSYWTHSTNKQYLQRQVVLGRWRPIPVFSKGTPRLIGGFCDTIHVEGQEKEYHDWQQPVEVFEGLIDDFTEPGDLVVDPCGGSFTTAVACYRLKRQFIGCDIDEQCVKLGWDRLDNERTGRQWKVPGNVLPPKMIAEEPSACTCRSVPRQRDPRQAVLGMVPPLQSL